MKKDSGIQTVPLITTIDIGFKTIQYFPGKPGNQYRSPLSSVIWAVSQKIDQFLETHSHAVSDDLGTIKKVLLNKNPDILKNEISFNMWKNIWHS